MLFVSIKQYQKSFFYVHLVITLDFALSSSYSTAINATVIKIFTDIHFPISFYFFEHYFAVCPCHPYRLSSCSVNAHSLFKESPRLLANKLHPLVKTSESSLREWELSRQTPLSVVEAAEQRGEQKGIQRRGEMRADCCWSLSKEQ